MSEKADLSPKEKDKRLANILWRGAGIGGGLGALYGGLVGSRYSLPHMAYHARRAAPIGVGLGVLGGLGYSAAKHGKLPTRSKKTKEAGMSEATLTGFLDELQKLAGMPFLEQDRPAKVKEIFAALKRDKPGMPEEMKARIASRKGKKSPKSRKSPKDGGPAYKAPLTHVLKKGRYVKKK